MTRWSVVPGSPAAVEAARSPVILRVPARGRSAAVLLAGAAEPTPAMEADPRHNSG